MEEAEAPDPAAIVVRRMQSATCSDCPLWTSMAPALGWDGMGWDLRGATAIEPQPTEPPNKQDSSGGGAEGGRRRQERCLNAQDSVYPLARGTGHANRLMLISINCLDRTVQ